ncbi:MAG: transposase [Pseudomonadota bacterium]
MKFNPDIHHRRSIRLKNYNYSQNGAYFITICIQKRACLFGHIINNVMIFNEAGKMINEQWRNLAIRFNEILLDEYIIMPNHFHGIVIIREQSKDQFLHHAHANRATGEIRSPYNTTLSAIIRIFKSITTHHYIHGVKNHHWTPFEGKLWQRNYHEHIIRNELSLQKIRDYTKNNPYTWEKDSLFSNDFP